MRSIKDALLAPSPPTSHLQTFNVVSFFFSCLSPLLLLETFFIFIFIYLFTFILECIYKAMQNKE